MGKQQLTEHISVLLEEVIGGLQVREGEQYIDATLGSAGHAIAIAGKGGLLLGIDQDPQAIKRAIIKWKKAFPHNKRRIGKTAEFVLGNFKDIKNIAKNHGFTQVSGILFDLGVSSQQLQDKRLGLSFSQEAPLDMRLDPKLKQTAADLVNQLTAEELYEIFIRNTQEELARPIAEAIVSARNLKPILTTGQLSDIICSVKSRKSSKPHPATKVFLALRMQVNQETSNLKQGVKGAIDILRQTGRLAVISFHESEDRLVKRIFKRAALAKQLEIITKKPITPSLKEISGNPRSRSAKLRIAEKI